MSRNQPAIKTVVIQLLGVVMEPYAPTVAHSAGQFRVTLKNADVRKSDKSYATDQTAFRLADRVVEVLNAGDVRGYSDERLTFSLDRIEVPRDGVVVMFVDTIFPEAR